MLKRLKVYVVAAAATLFMAAAASAAPLIDFSTGTAGEGGSLVLVGGDVVGTDIPVGLVNISGADLSNGSYNVFGTVSAQNPGSFGDLDFNTAGTVTIEGCIPGLNVGTFINGVCTSPALLLSGSITSFTLDGDSIRLRGIDTKNPELLAAIGLPADTPFALSGFLLSAADTISTNASPSVSTDIKNTAVPEPATMVLLGTGLLAAFRARRRQA